MAKSWAEYANQPVGEKTDRQPSLRSFPLSSGQERLWFLAQLDPDSRSYNATKVLQMSGPLDSAILQQALNEIVRRHEILRTTFQMEGGSLCQSVQPYSSLPLQVGLVPGGSAAERKKTLRALMRESALQPFDLAWDRVLRIILWQLSEQKHFLQLVVHHIAADGGSIAVFVSELARLYNALLKGMPANLAELPVQYGDYAVSQRKSLESETVRKGIEYWKKQLNGAPYSLDLCLDYRRPAHPSCDVGTELIALPPVASKSLQVLSSQNRVTVFMTLLAVLGVLLQRYAGQSDFLIGVPATRRTPETEQLIGFFLNTLVLRLDLSGDPTFQELLARVRRTALGAFAHQDVPLELLVQEIQPARYAGGQPPFQVMFVYSNTREAQPRMDGLEVSQIDLHVIPAKVDLSFYVNVAEEEPRIECQYDIDIFAASSIRRMLEHWVRLLESASADPSQALSNLQCFTATERHQLLYRWNETDRPFPSAISLQQLFEQSVLDCPDAPAVITRKRSISYRQLEEQANRVAHLLVKLGVRRGDLVAVHLDRSIDLIVGLLGVLKTGAAYVPLEITYPTARISWIISSLCIRHAVIGTARTAALMGASTLEHLVCLDSGGTASFELEHPRIWTQADVDRQPAGRPHCWTEPDDLAYIVFTSGSTGVPKGVMVAHGPVINVIDWVNRTFGVGRNDRVLCTSSICFDLSVYDVFGLLAAGGSIYLASPMEVSDPEALLSLLTTEPITFWNSAPATLQQLTPLLSSAPAVEQEPALRLVFLSGDWIPVALPDLVRARFPRAKVIALGGATEAAIWSNYYPVEKVDAAWPSIPYGQPIQNARYYILDEHLNPCPVGVRGDLYIGGECLAYGYAGQTAITAAAFIPDRFSRKPGSRLYRTGDRARWRTDGNIEFLGRIDGQVKIRGFRVEIGEIENTLARCQGVRDAVVTVGPDPSGDKCLIAFIVGEAVPEAALRSFLRDRLPEYMVPAAFLPLERLPLSANGKLDRKALPRPEWNSIGQNRAYEPPQTPVEVMLTALWTESLGVPRIGRHDNFFELGGHSLLATRLIFKIRADFKIDLKLRALFDSPTLAALAAAVENAQSSHPNSEPAIPRASRERPLPLSFSQERLWFLSQLAGADSPAYTIAGGARLHGDLDIAAFAQALKVVIQRHESLRTVFHSVDGRPVQEIRTDDLPALSILDFRHLSHAAAEEQVTQVCSEHAGHSFNLSGEPLFRAALIVLAPGEHVFVLAMHHAIGDGWSIQVLLGELKVVYGQLRNKMPPELPLLAIQYADFACWQRARLTPHRMEPHLAFWKQQFSSEPPVLNLPLDRPRGANGTTRGRRERVLLGAELRAAMQDLAAGQNASLFHALLSSFQALLYRYTSQIDISIGIPISGRTRPELEPLIGCFVNTLAIRTGVSGELTFPQLLAQTRGAMLDAYARAEAPFEMVVDHLNVSRDPSRNPLFQVMFSYGEDIVATVEFEGILTERLELESRTAKFDLTLAISDTGNDLRCSLEYRSDLFDPSTVQRLLRHWANLLGSITADPSRPLRNAALLTHHERLQILSEASGSRRGTPPALFPAMFQSRVELAPASPAINSIGQILSYAELNLQANALAWRLLESSVGPEVPVAICMTSRPELLIGLVGILKSGGAFVPLDPDHPDERLRQMLDDLRSPVLLTEQSLASRFRNFEGQILCIDEISLGKEAKPNPPVSIAGDSLAYIIYTSGSTGKPKGVMIPHSGLSNYLQHCVEQYFGLGGEGAPLHSSIGFDLTITTLLAPLAAGDCVLMGRGGHSLEMLADLIQAGQDFSFIKLTPAHLELLNHSLPPESAARAARALIIGGEALHQEQLSFFRRHVPHTRLINEYGPTEATVGCCIYDVLGAESTEGTVPIGRPISGAQLYLLDDSMELIPPGCPGDLYIGGESLARGYYGQPVQTAEAFLPDVLSGEPGRRLYRTGDLARRRNDGNLEFLGRKDLQVKVRGVRVEPAEIEASLCRYPGIDQALVVRGSGRWDGTLVAYFVFRGHESPVGSDLHDFLAETLPAYMVPSAFVRLSGFPLNAHGKIDRSALPLPAAPVVTDEEGKERPADKLEQQIMGIWESLLDTKLVSVTANYFDLGGNSLQLIQLHQRLESSLLIRFPLVDLFRYPTIRSLARHLAGRGANTNGSIMEQRSNSEARKRIDLLRSSRKKAAEVSLQS